LGGTRIETSLVFSVIQEQQQHHIPNYNFVDQNISNFQIICMAVKCLGALKLSVNVT